MDSKSISSWIRQARYRAGKRKIHSDLQIADVHEIIDFHGGHCAYCDESKKCEEQADTLDHPFPLSENTPNVPANVLPACKEIKAIKKSNDIVWLFTTGVISESKYLEIIASMIQRRGGNLLKKHLKTITGIQDE